LKNNKYHQFDTVLMMIDHFNLKDTVNNAKTFFAPTDYVIRNLMLNLKLTNLTQLEGAVTSKLFKQYMFSQSITMSSVSLTPTAYTNYVGNTLAPCGINLTTATEQVNGATGNPIFTYYILNYKKVNGLLDGATGPVAGDAIDITLPCQTTGIMTASGTTLHVFSNNLVLNPL
jgi:hypothetical protein